MGRSIEGCWLVTERETFQKNGCLSIETAADYLEHTAPMATSPDDLQFERFTWASKLSVNPDEELIMTMSAC